MLKAEQIPDEVVEAALKKRGLMREAIADAINAWPGSYSLAENDSAEIRDVAVIILPLTENTND